MVYLSISMDILPDKDLEFEQAVQWLVRLGDEVEGEFRQLISREIGDPEKASLYYPGFFFTRADELRGRGGTSPLPIKRRQRREDL